MAARDAGAVSPDRPAAKVADLLTEAIRAASGLGVDIPESELRTIVKVRDRLLEPNRRGG